MKTEVTTKAQTVEITTKGIRKLLDKFSPEQAIAEYIWNGFDAKATIVKVDFEIDSNEFDTLKSIKICDNGNGICFEDLPLKFKKFYESEKNTNIKEGGEFTKGKMDMAD